MEREAYSPVSSTESLDLRLGRRLKSLLGDSTDGNESLQSGKGDVPDLLVLFLQQEDDTRGLGVERAGHVQDSRLDDVLDGVVGDRALVLEGIDSATGLDRLQESGRGGVLEFNLSRAHCDGD